MNWKTYKTMTEEQHKEYDYKFRDRPGFHLLGFLPTVIILLLISVQIVFVSYLFVIDEGALTGVGIDNVSEYFNQATTVIGVVMIIIITSIIFDAIKLFWSRFSEKRWLKKNNIQLQGGKFAWLR